MVRKKENTFNCLSASTFEIVNRKQKSHSKLNKSNLQMLTFAFLHLDIKEEAGHVIKMAENTGR